MSQNAMQHFSYMQINWLHPHSVCSYAVVVVETDRAAFASPIITF